jgi:vacuolar protein-sorting-associated protein 4
VDNYSPLVLTTSTKTGGVHGQTSTKTSAAQAVALVRQAVAEDDAGDYAAALQHYVHALDYFAAHLRYERNPKVRDAIAARLPGYVSRAEEIRALLDGQAGRGGEAAEACWKGGHQRKKDDGEDDERGAERAKLRAGLHSAIVSEKPDVRWDDVAGLDGAKQALQEAVVLPVKYPQFFTGMSSFADFASIRKRVYETISLCAVD